MPITGLLRSWSCPDKSAQPLHAQNISGLGESLSDVRTSSAVLSRSLSRSSAAAHAQNGTRSSAAGLDSFGGMHKAQAINDLFGATRDEKQLTLLMTTFLKSSNAYACREITAFAKVYSQLLHQPNLSEEARATLEALAQQYTDKIVDDGLGEKSAFGPWTAKLDKRYQQRSALEHTLATFANSHSAGDFLQLGSVFMAREVMPFIQTCIEQQLGETLSETTCQRLHELVDNAAMKTFVALRQSSVELVEQRGVGVGKLARDLDTVATLPLILRDILANLPKDLPQTAQQTPVPNISAVPDSAGPSPGPSLGQGLGGITINIGDIHIDKSQHIDNSRHINHRHAGSPGESSTPTPLAQNLNLRVNLKVNSDTTSKAMSRTNGDNQYAGELLFSRDRVQEAHVQTVESLKADGGYVLQETRYASIPAGEIKTLQHVGTQTSASGLFNAAQGVADSLSHLLDRVDTRGMPQSDVIIKGGGHSQRNELTAMPAQERQENELQTVADKLLTFAADTRVTSQHTAFPSGPTLQQSVKTELQKAGKPDASETEKPTVSSSHAKLKFREGNLYTLPTLAYLRSTGGQLKPEHELLKAVRSMLEADSNQPLAIRRDFDGLRNRLLPGYDVHRTQLLQEFRNGPIKETVKNDLKTLHGLLAEHPGLDRRRPAVANFARTLIRECGLIKPGQPPNPLVVALLDGVAGTGDNKWDWRGEAQHKQPQSSASGVVLTTDGLHLGPLHMRKNYHAK